MNSLELINEEIEYLQDMISMDLALVEDEFDLQEIGKKQKRLKVLQKIKAELEAWEVVKDKVEIKRTEVFDHVLRIKQGKGALTHEEFRPLKNLIRVGDK